MRSEILREYGIDYAQGLERCMNDEAFYARFLSMFLQDDTLDRAKIARDAGRRDTMFQCLHELKGVCGNAAMTTLYQAVCPLVELLRVGEASWEDINTQFDQVIRIYDNTKEGVFIATQNV